MSRMNFSSSTMRTRGRSSFAVVVMGREPRVRPEREDLTRRRAPASRPTFEPPPLPDAFRPESPLRPGFRRATVVGSMAGRASPLPLAVTAYACLALGSLGIGWLGDRSPLSTTPLLELPALPALSLAGGVLLGLGTVR